MFNRESEQSSHHHQDQRVRSPCSYCHANKFTLRNLTAVQSEDIARKLATFCLICDLRNLELIKLSCNKHFLSVFSHNKKRRI